MTETLGRRERKKVATRQNIAATARRLFLDRGYDEVGLREIATEADVAVTTLFAHFGSKEALVFEADHVFEQQLVAAARDRGPDEPLVPALQRQIKAMVRHCSSAEAAPLWTMIDGSPDLRAYEQAMLQRHAESLAAAIAHSEGLRRTTTSCSALARFAVDAFTLGRQATRPNATVDELFVMIDAAWQARR